MKVKRSLNRLYKICIEENRVVCLLTKAEEVSHGYGILDSGMLTSKRCNICE